MSKYASLPDIDVSGADVFETPDLPPQHSYLGDSDSEDEYLNRTTTAGASSSSSPKTRRQATGAKQQTRDDAAYVNEDRLDAHEARDRFKRVVHLERQTGARAARRDLPLGRRTLPATPEYVIQGGDVENRERESPLERLRRLRSEIAELEDEVERDETARAEGDAPDRDDDESDAREDKTGQHDDADDKGHKAKGTTTKRQVSPAVILQQLHLLRGDLDGIRPTVEKMAAGDRARTARDGRGEFGARAKASSELLTKLAQDRQGEPPHLVQPSSSSSPPSNGVAKDARIATREGELESRVAQLERMIGANEADLDDTTAHPVPLAPTVSRLDHLLTLLTQPRHLDSISRRVKVLTSDLERIHESRRKLGDTRPLTVALQGGVMTLSTTGGSTTAHATSSGPGTSSTTTTTMGIPPDALQKIDALFGLLARIDPLVPLAPRLLARLRSLQALHESSTTFATALQGAEGELAALGERRAGLDQVLASLEETFRANEHKFETNLKALEHRLEGVGKRLDDLNQ